MCDFICYVQIGESAGAECKMALQETTKLVEQRLEKDGRKLKSLFDAADVCLFLSCFLIANTCYIIVSPQTQL